MQKSTLVVILSGLLLIVTLQLTVLSSFADAAEQPTSIRRISKKYGCALYGTKGVFKLGTLNSSGIFKIIASKKIKGNKSLEKSEKICKRIKGTGVVFTSFPTAESITFNTSPSALKIRTASGTPPTLSSLTSGAAAPLFWRAGVLGRLSTNTPTAEDCSEFYGSTVEGRSAGHSLCKFVDGLGQFLFLAKRIESNSCYLKKLISPSSLGRAATLVSGRLPDGSAELIFDTPTGSGARVIKATIADSGIDVFVKINSANSNRTSRFDYSSETWSCLNGTLTSYEIRSVTSSDKLYSLSAKSLGLNLNLNSYLIPSSGSVIVDITRNRSVSVLSDLTGTLFKTSMNILPGSIYEQRLASLIAGKSQKLYSISSLTGSSESDLRLTENASKYILTNSGVNVASGVGYSEYRDSGYTSSETSAFSSSTSIDLNSDSFFNSGLTSDFDASLYSCSTTPDLTFSINLTHPDAISGTASCIPTPSTLNSICSAQQIILSDLNYQNVCNS